MRLAWPPPWHIVASVLIPVAALAVVHLSPPTLQGALSLSALIMVFLIPGYLAILSIFPGKNDLDGQRRAFLCLVSSVILAGLFSLILTATPRGLQSASLATILSLLAIFLAAVSYGRWSNLPRKRRFLLLPKRGMGSTRTFPRAALAVLLLAACFIAALAFAYGPHLFASDVPFTKLEVNTPAVASVSPSSPSEEGKPQFQLTTPYQEERLQANLSQNNSPAIPDDMSKATILNTGGSGSGGSMGGGSSSSSSQAAVKNTASSKASQPEKAAIPLQTAAKTAASNVQSNTSVVRKNNTLDNASNLSIQSSKENLTFNMTGTQEIIQAAKPAKSPSSTVAANNETIAAFDNSTGNISANTTSSQEGLSSESNLSRAISQSDTKPDESQGQEIANSNQLPILKALVPDRSSPQQQGAAIFWKAEATDEDGDKILYRFFLDGREVRKWSKTNSWSWLSQGLSAGDYLITVLAIDGKHATEDSFDSIINTSFTLSSPNQAPLLQELKTDRASPQGRGSIITWTASASDPDSDRIYYKFLKNDGEMTDWSTSNSWVWDTSSEKPGDYKISVLAKDGLHASKDSFDSSMDGTFALTLPNSLPEVPALKADRSSPQAIGSIITWKAEANDPDGDDISYKFLADGKEVRKWSSSNSWVWDTSSAKPAEYKITVLVRDARHSSEDSFDSSKDAVFNITIADSNLPPVLESLVADIASPKVQGTQVIWKAKANDPEGDKILYKFQLNGRDMGRWTEMDSWKWSSRDLPAADYKIRVLARDGKHAPENSFDSSMDAVFSLISEIDQQIDQLMKKRSTDATKQENYQSSDIQVASGNGTNANVVLGKSSSSSTAVQETAVTPRKLGS